MAKVEFINMGPCIHMGRVGLINCLLSIKEKWKQLRQEHCRLTGYSCETMPKCLSGVGHMVGAQKNPVFFAFFPSVPPQPFYFLKPLCLINISPSFTLMKKEESSLYDNFQQTVLPFCIQKLPPLKRALVTFSSILNTKHDLDNPVWN